MLRLTHTIHKNEVYKTATVRVHRMPAKGFKAITVREKVYELAKRIIEEDSKRIESKHRNVAELIESAVVWYVKQNYPDLYEKIRKELEGEEK